VEQFIDPKILARVKDLQLVARTVGDGFLQGIQSSHQRGVGIEFSQYRTYEPGDDPGRIDWKLYARSDRYFVREADRESEISVVFVLDASGSMAQQSEEGAWSKFACARTLLATLAYLAQHQGDRAGLLCLSEPGVDFLPATAGERQWHRILRHLQATQPTGRFPVANRLKAFIPSLQAAELVVFISDFHESRDEILSFVHTMNSKRNDILALQMLCDDERSFPWRGPTRFEDLETGDSVLLSAQSARTAYLQALSASQNQLRSQLGRYEIGLESFNVDAPLDGALHHVLKHRQKRLRT
jgi:uncharacterized protein (DUF58 family)